MHVHHESVVDALAQEFGTLAGDRLCIAEHGPYRHEGACDVDAVRQVFGLGVDERFVVVPGQLRAYKAPEFLAEVLAQLGPDDSVPTVVFAGGVTPSVPRDVLQRLRAHPRVRFATRLLNDAEYSALVAQAQAVWLSYRRISTSGSLFHALSAGTPVLAPALGTIPHYVSSGDNGVLYAAGDVTGCALALRRLWSLDTHEREQWGLRAKRSVSHLSWAAMRTALFGSSEMVMRHETGPSWWILDPGLRDTFTHHHSLNEMLVARAQAEHLRVEVLIHRDVRMASIRYPCRPTFSASLYADRADLDEAQYGVLVGHHAADFATQWAQHPRPADCTLIVHSATAALLQGLARALEQAAQVPAALLVQLMFPPSAFAIIDAGSIAERRYALALRAIRALGRTRGLLVRWSSATAEFAQRFSALSGNAVEIHPYALLAEADLDSRRALAARLPPSANLGVLLFAGDPKIEKGVAWVTGTLPKLLQRFPDTDFTVQLGPNRFASASVQSCIERLRELAANPPRLRLIERHLDLHQWRDLLHEHRVMVLPYDPAHFHGRSSGIFWERLFWQPSGASIIVTQGSWLSRESTALGVAAEHCEFGNDFSLIQTLDRALCVPASGRPTYDLPCFAEGNDSFLMQQWRATQTKI